MLNSSTTLVNKLHESDSTARKKNKINFGNFGLHSWKEEGKEGEGVLSLLVSREEGEGVTEGSMDGLNLNLFMGVEGGVRMGYREGLWRAEGW